MSIIEICGLDFTGLQEKRSFIFRETQMLVVKPITLLYVLGIVLICSIIILSSEKIIRSPKLADVRFFYPKRGHLDDLIFYQRLLFGSEKGRWGLVLTLWWEDWPAKVCVTKYRRYQYVDVNT